MNKWRSFFSGKAKENENMQEIEGWKRERVRESEMV